MHTKLCEQRLTYKLCEQRLKYEHSVFSSTLTIHLYLYNNILILFKIKNKLTKCIKIQV
jgi:hypothetical protein